MSDLKNDGMPFLHTISYPMSGYCEYEGYDRDYAYGQFSFWSDVDSNQLSNLLSAFYCEEDGDWNNIPCDETVCTILGIDYELWESGDKKSVELYDEHERDIKYYTNFDKLVFRYLEKKMPGIKLKLIKPNIRL